MKRHLFFPLILSLLSCCGVASADGIAGSDFSNAATFNEAGGEYDIVHTDDLNPHDGIHVADWQFVNAGKFEGLDANAQVDMPYDLVTKIDGNGVDALPAVGEPIPTTAGVQLDITIPANRVVDLTNVTWDWRQATGGATNTRALAFHTSLDTTTVFKEVGLIRNEFDSELFSFDDAKYKGLTDQTVSFFWYAGEGTGTHDIDFDTVVINGDVAVVPEPASCGLALTCLLGMGLVRRRRAA